MLFFICKTLEECGDCRFGECIDNQICECKDKYSTYPHDSNIKCSYKKKKTMDSILIRSNPFLWSWTSLFKKLWFWNCKINYLVNNISFNYINEVLYNSKRMER